MPMLTQYHSWNTRLARARASSLGREARIKGVNVLLGPAIGPLGRVVTGGRNWEGKLDIFPTSNPVIHTYYAVLCKDYVLS